LRKPLEWNALFSGLSNMTEQKSMSDETLICNARLVNEGRVFESDLLVRNGRIERIDPDIPAPSGARVYDAGGACLLPGMIDDQVHFREPGLTHKGCIRTESRAAVAGGVTSFMEMPNTRPTTTTHDELDNKLAIGARDSAANYGFFFGATNDNIDAIRTLDPRKACGIKVFMGASTGNMLVDREQTLDAIFRDAPVVIATHCESTPMIQENLKAAMSRFGKDIPLTEHHLIRSREACLASSTLAVELARRHDAQLHVLHITTADELELFEPGPIEGKSITAETCVHFLHFCADDYPALGNRIKCNPSIKLASDRDALRAALKSGRIDILATDHAPHTIEEKADPAYLKAPAGLPLVQDVVLAALELVHDGDLAIEELVDRIAHNPARRFDVEARGFLREGYWADLTLVDTGKGTEVTSDRVLAFCGWSPFEGRSFRSRIQATWVNGALAFDGTKVIEHGQAMALSYAR
jgi:dihydroorotase